MGKFKIGDRVRCIDDSGTDCVKSGQEYDVTGVDDPYIYVCEDGEESGMYAYRFELVVPTFTIVTDKFYRTASGAVTGRVTKGDTGFEAVVDGKVRIFDAAGGAVHGGDDIVEEWVPKVGERVRFVRDSTAGGARFGRKGDTATVAGDVREGNNVFGAAVDVKVDGSSIGFNPSAYLSDLEPLPVAVPQPAAPVLVIEAGKFYRTRDGRKVGPIVVAQGFDDPWPWKATGVITSYYFKHNGYSCPGSAHLHADADDLVAEWQETANVAAQVDAIAEEYGPAPQREPDTTLHLKFTSDFSDLDAAILVRKRKLKKLIKLARKAGIELREAA